MSTQEGERSERIKETHRPISDPFRIADLGHPLGEWGNKKRRKKTEKAGYLSTNVRKGLSLALIKFVDVCFGQ
ncbi:hypothetical protein GWI33_018730 [Rhynchophorus ferrugineus]|uniref:Uncharacterized protein n=1 Tax=Rhynchophorus ferrugineus TaxID=354439 RepID=A0A834HXA2_RHYFE|nr:hypothetical protein GWI33_018730 [Rhynchophorus ferrugineus]